MIDGYGDATKALIAARLDRSLKHEIEIYKLLNAMSSQQHLDIIHDIIMGHAGGTQIRVDYDLPFDDANKTHKRSLDDIHDFYNHCTIWKATITPGQKGITIANYDITKNPNAVDDNNYKGYTYRRYKIKTDELYGTGSKFEVDFRARSQGNIQTLLCFGPFIYVSVYNLLVPKHIICRPHRTNLSQPLPETDEVVLMEDF